MNSYLELIFAYNLIPYTIFLIVILFFWFTVILGFLDIEIFDGVEGVDVDDIEANPECVFHLLFSFLGIGVIPISIIISVLAIVMWTIAYLLNDLFPNTIFPALPALIANIIAFIIILPLSSIITGLLMKPLKNKFETTQVRGHHHLIGQVCKIKSSEVTKSFGQAELQVKDSFLLISVKEHSKNKKILKKGDEAIIVEYDNEKDFYKVSSIKKN